MPKLETIAAYQDRMRKNKARKAGLCTICKKEPLYNKNVCTKCRVVQSGYKRTRYKAFREAVIAVMGGCCVRCGFSDPRALQIDHIYGGGAQERKSLMANAALYRAIVKDTIDMSCYQLLCANCNWIKRDENKEYFLGLGNPDVPPTPRLDDQ